MYGYLRCQYLCGAISTVPECRTFLLDSLCTPTWNLKVHQLDEFAICTNPQGGNERSQLMSKLVQITDVHFPDLNSNSTNNLNNMKLDLNISLDQI